MVTPICRFLLVKMQEVINQRAAALSHISRGFEKSHSVPPIKKCTTRHFVSRWHAVYNAFWSGNKMHPLFLIVVDILFYLEIFIVFRRLFHFCYCCFAMAPALVLRRKRRCRKTQQRLSLTGLTTSSRLMT